MHGAQFILFLAIVPPPPAARDKHQKFKRIKLLSATWGKRKIKNKNFIFDRHNIFTVYVGGVETGSLYVRYVAVISANTPCTYNIHRDIYELCYVHVPRYVLGRTNQN